MALAMIVHGGAWNIPDEEAAAHRDGCAKALQGGWEHLVAGGSALKAVEQAIRAMEDDPTFNAGVGSFLNLEGNVELDAGIMDGHDLRAGAVAAVPGIKNPITLAHLVMTESEHVLIVGSGALRFAREHGIEPLPPRRLIVARELARWAAERHNIAFHTQDPFAERRGTVGAVAMDAQGNIAAGTSTGGTLRKYPGRVGDSPLIGCGLYADNRCGGASSTGWGEAIIRVVMAKTAVDLMGQGMPVQEAAEKTIALLVERVQGLGGIILVSAGGEIGLAFNTPRMAYAYRQESLPASVVGI